MNMGSCLLIHKICIYTLFYIVYFSGVSTVGPSGACALLTFSLFNVISNKQIGYFYCSYYTHMNNLEVVIMLCSHESIFHAGHLLLAVQVPAHWQD